MMAGASITGHCAWAGGFSSALPSQPDEPLGLHHQRVDRRGLLIQVVGDPSLLLGGRYRQAKRAKLLLVDVGLATA